MSEHVDDVEEWAENHALTNSPVAEEVDSEIDRLEVKGNETGDCCVG